MSGMERGGRSHVGRASIQIAIAFLALSATTSSQVNAGDPSWSRWRPRLISGRVELSRYEHSVEGFDSQMLKKPAWFSIAELATWCNSNGLRFTIGDQLLIQTWDRKGSARISLKSGKVATAAGSLHLLEGKTLPRVQRASGEGWFLTSEGIDFLINMNWLEPILRGRHRTSKDGTTELIQGPYGASVPGSMSGYTDTRGEVESFAPFMFKNGRLEMTVSAKVRKMRFQAERAEVIQYSAVFKNISSKPIVVQPTMLRPVAKYRLDFVQPKGLPFGPQSIPLRTDTNGASPWATYILAPGEMLKTSLSEIPIPYELTKHARGSITMSYEDGHSSYEFSLAFLKTEPI